MFPAAARPRRAHVLGGALALGAAGAMLPASPAAADAPGPSDYRSTITEVRPATGGFAIEVTGGDAFLELRAEPGHEVVVLGYDDEPYLRFRPDGTVEANLESDATYVNTSLSGTVEVPEGVDPGDPPRWTTVAGDGTYAWHDHRVHWMGTQRPPGVERDGEIRRWTVPLRVDDQPVAVEGVLTLAPANAWWPWPLAVVAVAGATWILGRRRPGTVATCAAGAGCAIAVAVGAAEQLSLPAEAGRRLVPVLVPAVGAVAALAALATPVLPPLRRRPSAARNLALLAAAAGASWAVLRLTVLTRPVLVTDLPPDIDRAGTATALALTLAAAALLLAASQNRATAPATPDPAATASDAGSLGTASTESPPDAAEPGEPRTTPTTPTGSHASAPAAPASRARQ